MISNCHAVNALLKSLRFQEEASRGTTTPYTPYSTHLQTTPTTPSVSLTTFRGCGVLRFAEASAPTRVTATTSHRTMRCHRCRSQEQEVVEEEVVAAPHNLNATRDKSSGRRRRASTTERITSVRSCL